jgi:hypothetical protein
MSEKRTYPVDPEELRRLEICKSCEHYQLIETEGSQKKFCGACGCPLVPRINHPKKHGCPLRKWL